MHVFVNTSISSIAFAVILATGALSGCGGGGGASTPTTQGGSGTTSGGADGTSTSPTTPANQAPTPANQAPTVTCPAALSGRVGSSVSLSCTATDDGLPSSALTYRWEWVSAPASTTLSATSAAQTSFVPAVEGDYALTLTVSDGALETKKTLSVSVIPGVWKIMPIGDSITQADSVHQSYRYSLWRKLIDKRVPFDFVGSLDTNYGGNPPSTSGPYPNRPPINGVSFDLDHEGHYGWRADQVAELSGLADSVPDIALIHLGTNDILQGQDVQSTLTDFAKVVAKLRAKNAKVRIFIAQIIPVANDPENRIKSLNDAIPGWASGLSSGASPVTVVDQFTGYGPTTDNESDGIHPNALGEEKIAQRWFDAIKGIVQ